MERILTRFWNSGMFVPRLPLAYLQKSGDKQPPVASSSLQDKLSTPGTLVEYSTHSHIHCQDGVSPLAMHTNLDED
ncbi:hypothetical protein PHLCEN_2v9653 [Hermanssonia centrifuga]|uniref:Uncharacterized protein n=1 Tax=Hermanssonia centrifuga TaxID=98765 RepID=A0A2R6NQ64_9APHY|nr:hypothetical protein PHLCEN_2v9653 [Hermanssonia centrifuga]